MRKLINDPADFVDESVEGILLAFPEHFRRAEGSMRGLVRAESPIHGKVGICTGGGSGHLPLFLGYVGEGLLDGVAIGNVFSSPSPDDMLAVIKSCHGGEGVLLLYGNYSGDVLNFDMAAEMAADEGIEVLSRTGVDDVASAPQDKKDKRRAIAGIALVYKVVGAAAKQGHSLSDLVAVADDAIFNTRSMGVALSGTTIPTVGQPGFDVPEGEMEVGMGIHGEPGVERGPLREADEIVEELIGTILNDFGDSSPSRVALLVNTLGATAIEEAYVMLRKSHQLLGAEGIEIARSYVGEFATSMEMAGASISVMRLDERLEILLTEPAYSPLLPSHLSPPRDR